jgi:NADH-quinone oxidoreductase subunit E
VTTRLRELSAEVRELEARLKEGGGADKIALTTPDGKYTLRTVACFGQCALAPVVEINHSIYGHVNEQALHREVEALEKDNGK